MKFILFIREHLKKIIIILVIIIVLIIVYVIAKESVELISKLWNTKGCSQATQCICKQNEVYCNCLAQSDNTETEVLCPNRTIPYNTTENNCNLASECLCKKNEETCACQYIQYNYKKYTTCENNQF